MLLPRKENDVVTMKVIGLQRRIIWKIPTFANQFAVGKKDGLVVRVSVKSISQKQSDRLLF